MNFVGNSAASKRVLLFCYFLPEPIIIFHY